MTLFVRLFLSLVTIFALCNCAATSSPKHLAPMVSPVTGKATPFTLRSAIGIAKPSQIMAALEEYNEDIQADRAAGRDPLSVLAKSLNHPNRTRMATVGGSMVGMTRAGSPITLYLPAIAVDGGTLPPAEVARAMPDVQRYCYRLLSRHMRPVDTNELTLKKK